MSGRPSAAAEHAKRWLAAGHGTAAEAARKFGLSPGTGRRIAASVGLAPRPVGRPARLKLPPTAQAEAASAGQPAQPAKS